MPEIGPYYPQDSSYYRTLAQQIAEFEEYMSGELGTTFKMPTHKIVCLTCDGKGTHANRSIDGNGLSPDDPDLDEEFWENYRSGAYDVVCEECGGTNVTDEVDEDKLDPGTLREWGSWVSEQNAMVQEQLGELRFGA